VYAYNSRTGEQLWTYATQGSVDFMAIGVDGNLIVGSEDDNVYSLRAA
jgi:outer membrane protein assembly factor BamB